MECPECNREMKIMPYMLTSNPPQDEYRCECGHIERVTIGTYEKHEIKWFGVLNNGKEPFFEGYSPTGIYLKNDMPLNGGRVCHKHGIGYVKECPSCAFEKMHLTSNE